MVATNTKRCFLTLSDVLSGHEILHQKLTVKMLGHQGRDGIVAGSNFGQFINVLALPDAKGRGADQPNMFLITIHLIVGLRQKAMDTSVIPNPRERPANLLRFTAF